MATEDLAAWRSDVAVDVYSGVRQREEWDDDVARPRLEQVLQAFVGRDGCGEAAAGTPRVLRCGLLAEEPPECPGVLEVASRRRVSRGQHAHGDARDRGMYARGESCEPDPEADEKVRDTVLHADAAEHQDHGIQPDGEAEGWHGDMAGVREGDDGQGHDVVDDHQGQQKGSDPHRRAAADQTEDAERERGVGAHDDSPAPGGRLAGIEREVDERGRRHAADGGQYGRGNAPSFAQVAHVELATDLQADDEEEEGDQTVVDPVAEVERQFAGCQGGVRTRWPTPAHRCPTSASSPRPTPRVSLPAGQPHSSSVSR